ncbi:MAG: SecY-interacting protein [Oleiphilaceae bacterium]|nr:SecY-interacting protein [Oleiphilaceae bacterium]
MNPVTLALEALHQRYRNLWQQDRDSLPQARFQRPWPSPCINATQQQSDEVLYTWEAQPRSAPIAFYDLEKALEVTFHSDIKAFYGSFWADSIPIEHPVVDALLLQVWNDEDQQRLFENLLGHAFARLKGRLPLTLFIACTHGDDMVCIDNESGQVVLEKPGYPAHKVIAESLESWLLQCQPCFDNYA